MSAPASTPIPDPGPLAQLLDLAPGLAAALPGIERAAHSTAALLFVGEPGSGRSTLARACHTASTAGRGPLVDLDAGAIPTTLFESELFGYRVGAFSGATSAAPGRVERASDGTLLLDHVEELPLAVQPKLLQLLSERLYAPLGGAAVRTNARFMAIGSEDLPARVQSGAFRQDLYFRLAVVTFRLPPLRERRADLPATLETLLAELGERFARPGLALTPRARAWMSNAPWPGNLRQMRNVLERALVLTDRALLDPEPGPGLDGSAAGEPRPVTLAELEREHILRALAYTRGRQGRAAELLGISRKALWEKRNRFGLP